MDLAANAIQEGSGTAQSLFLSMPTPPTDVGQLDWTPREGSPIATGGLTAFTGALATKAGTYVTPTAWRGAASPTGPKWWLGWTSYSDN